MVAGAGGSPQPNRVAALASTTSTETAARGRPRRVADAEIVAVALDIVLAGGPAALTFARLAERVSMVPASLAHRFGSREAMVAAVSKSLTRRYEALSRAERSERSAVAALIAFLVELSEPRSSPASVINQLALMQIELATPALSPDVARRSRAVLSTIRALVRAAVECGELSCAQPDQLAAALHGTQVGALLNWCVNPDGELRDRVERDVRFVLQQFLGRADASTSQASTRSK